MMLDVNIYRDSPGLRPGLGGITDMACDEAQRELAKIGSWGRGFWNPWYLYVKSVNDGCNTAVGAYQYLEYGTVPKPTPIPPPVAPKTQEQMTVPGAWTPEMTNPDIQAWIAAQQAAIKAAEDKGTYNPEGNTPLPSATTWDKYKWWFIGGAAALYFTLLYKGGKAYLRYR